jgi:predicted DNA-binding WGR domain protein
MKLIQQTRLVFQEGRSDKVYEVDLCEVGADQYTVNFRYGRRGASLKEGSKTSKAVPRREAEKIFNELVESKTKKGYRNADAQVPRETAAPQKVSAPADSDARNQAVLNRLADWQNKKHKWPLERAIWRAGELRITAAAPLLVNPLGSKDALRDYCIAWSLGRCGDHSSVASLTRLMNDSKTADFVRRIAVEALLKLSSEEARAEFRADMIEKLPAELREPARRGGAGNFSTALTSYLEGGDHQRFEVLDTIYLIDNENTRPALIELIKTAPLRANYFQRFRHIFKAAEYRRDAEVFGLLAYRFEKSPPVFHRTYVPMNKEARWPIYLDIDGNWIEDARKEILRPESRIGYGARTRAYLRRRVWRALRKMGEAGDPDYVRMAVGALLPYTDADGVAVKEEPVYVPAIRDFKKQYWDAYAPYYPFNFILYRHSPRYFLKNNSWFWQCRDNYKPGDAAPSANEEAFPGLWKQVPAGLMHLIAESECRPVVEFAARALAQCPEFCAALDTEDVMMILSRPYTEAARLGFELAKNRYRIDSPDIKLALAVAECALDEARAEALRWIEASRAVFLADSDFITALVTSQHADVRAFARNLLRSSVFADATARALIARLIAHLLSFAPEQADEARDVADTVLKSFGAQLRSIGITIVLDLLSHPMLEVQELGGNILLLHDTRPENLPAGVIDSLVASEFEAMRGIGIKLLSSLPLAEFATREDQLCSLAMNPHEDVRQAISPLIKTLCQSSATLAERLSGLFLDALFKPEPHEGVHASLARLLQKDVGAGWMRSATRGTAWKLVQAASPQAQELGGILIQYKVNSEALFAEGFDFDDLCELSNAEARTVREAAWMMFSKMLNRLQHAMNPDHLEEMSKAVRLLDSRWDDSRSFWIDMFRVNFTAEDFTPAILVSVCDSVREDVQQVGRELITRFFKEENGDEYLLKLSEHPSIDLQLFATNYLERYAAGDAARLCELRHYFVSVLSRVNKARTAKNRVIEFLSAEAEKSEEAARVVAEIFARQSVTIAVGDRAAAIEAMLRIREKYPDIPLPIQVRAPEVRHAV